MEWGRPGVKWGEGAPRRVKFASTCTAVAATIVSADTLILQVLCAAFRSLMRLFTADTGNSGSASGRLAVLPRSRQPSAACYSGEIPSERLCVRAIIKNNTQMKRAQWVRGRGGGAMEAGEQRASVGFEPRVNASCQLA